MKFNSSFWIILFFSQLIQPALFAQKMPVIGLGTSLGGSGLMGTTVQLRPVKNLAFEVGAYARLIHVNVFEPKWYFGVASDAGVSIFLHHKNKLDKERQIANGLFLKGSLGLIDLKENCASLGWVREIHTNKHPNQFVQFQIGPSLIQRTESYLNTRYPPGYQEQQESWVSGMLYTRLTWFFGVVY